MMNTRFHKFLQGGGEMGKLIRELDWSQTPLGSVEDWPQSLRTSVSSCINSRFPILLWWGKELVKIYNDAYISILGKKHPGALGKAGKEVWPEIWPIIGPMLEGVFYEGKATWSEDQLLLLERDGYPGECYFTFSYSPIFDESGGIGGVLCVVTETTVNVINARRLKTLQQLSSTLQQLPSDLTNNFKAEIFKAAAKVLDSNQHDFPYTKAYIVTKDNLKAEAIVDDDGGFLPIIIELDGKSMLDDLCRDAVNQHKIIITDDPYLNLSAMPTGTWNSPIQKAAIIPITKPEKTGSYGIIISCLNPHLPADDKMIDFLYLVSEQIATSITNSIALEEERKRVEALAEIDQVKTTFFSNISHEFRTPLTLMLGPLEEVLRDNSIADKHKENISLAFSNSLRLQKLVNNLLDFSRLEAGRMQVNYKETDISGLTAQLASNFQSAIENSGMKLLIICPPVMQPVFVDQDMWEKIVLNLLSNAFKYTLKGTIIVELEDLGDRFLLKVKDTGIGIPEDQIKHIFERFQQVKGAKGRSHEGTGIGLSMVKELVKLLGGTIEVSSQFGIGSTFTITIPTGKEHLPENISTVGDISDSSAAYIGEAVKWVDDGADLNQQNEKTNKSPAKPRILLADDNVEMRNYLWRLLSAEYDVRVVADGRQAIESLQESLPELVLTDVMMPDTDGFELLATLKNNPSTANIPVILLSARAGEEAIVEGFEKGADDYLIKPFSSRELLSKIRAQFNFKHARLSAERHLHNLFMQAPAGICVLSGPNLIYELVNPKYQQLLPGRKLLNRPIFEALPELKDQPLHDVLLNVYHNGETYEVNELLIPVAEYEGGPTFDRYFNFNYLPRLNETGKVDGILAFVFEVTEMVVSRRELATIRDNLKMAITAAQLGTFDMDLEKGTMEWDQRCRELFGISHEGTVTYEKDFVTGLHPEDRERIIKIIDNVFIKSISNGDYDVEYRTVGVEDQKIRWVKAMGKTYFDDQDKPLRFVGTVLEITERKEDEIRKNDFIGMVSHELKTPLTSLNAFIQVLHGMAVKDENQRRIDFLTKAAQQVKKMNTLINGFLNSSRLESGKIQLDLKTFYLDELITETIDEIKLTASSHQITLSPCDPVEVYADRDKIGSVIINLLSNAVKYSPKGKVIMVNCSARGKEVVVSIEDEGMGLKTEEIAHIFDRFYRVSSSHTQNISGFGIGLYLSAEIIKRHSGRIWVESEKGKGSTFYFTLAVKAN